jgi:hypothetical protein
LKWFADPHKSSSSSSLSGKKRKEDETNPKKEKDETRSKEALDINFFSLLKDTYSLTCVIFCYPMIFL